MLENEWKSLEPIESFKVEGVSLDARAVWHLQDAFEQMDLLLNTNQIEGGLICLVTMLRDLQMLRRLLRR